MDLNNTASRTDYHGKMNFQFLMLLWAHLPISWLTAGLAGQSYVTGTLFSLAILSLPTALVWRNRVSVEAAVANGVALVSFSALLIHLSGGMTEMHFHIFSALGLMITLAQPAAIVGAVLLVVVHHVGFFFLLPKSLINYDASFGILVIHAIFALSIGVPAFFISRKFKLYIVSVKGIVDDIQDIAAPLSESSLAMHKNSQTLSTSTKQEAGAVTRTASSLEQLTAMIAKNSDNAADVAKMSELSKQKSSRSLEIVAQVVEALVRIQQNSRGVLETVEQSNARMKKVVDLIAQIESKTGVINDIVFQTKLLSFNASVEAARAGEHGKGFAVVAEEVGNLARMSGTSAQEISSLLQTSARDVHNLIDQSQREISSIVNDGQAQIHEGMSVAEQCKSMLADIDSGLLEASRIAVEIATASKEQSQGVSEITKAMNDIETASSKTSEVSNHTAETAATLTEGTEKLAQAVNRLINTVQKGAA